MTFDVALASASADHVQPCPCPGCARCTSPRVAAYATDVAEAMTIAAAPIDIIDFFVKRPMSEILPKKSIGGHWAQAGNWLASSIHLDEAPVALRPILSHGLLLTDLQLDFEIREENSGGSPYSKRNASMGFRLAAFRAGYTPNIKPMATEKPIA